MYSYKTTPHFWQRASHCQPPAPVKAQGCLKGKRTRPTERPSISEHLPVTHTHGRQPLFPRHCSVSPFVLSWTPLVISCHIWRMCPIKISSHLEGARDALRQPFRPA